ncbi:OmpP1/FadL family transporter [Flavivirga jejuensis]|uniref:Long-subunit fatty acid transport protein n=1 Tax=Flavivirga jejuensis TaxID=870487 RepID=A0ABT8WKR2_9FLAO|nr:hypothetical protein [Flavivirga jejuensis]MDO5973746.1 hypothetical protein [Flavivirga jejuensis]
MLKQILLLLFLLISNALISQNGTSTPYSLFGLGIENKTATGGLTGLGNTGFAQKNISEINIYNPANLGNMEQNSFLYEFGINGVFSEIKTDNTSDKTNDANISHFAIAFPIKKGLGVSLGLLPYTKVGYDVDLQNYIEGSTSTYTTRITGLGGLSKFYLSSGIKIDENLSLGVDLSFLFGSIDQETQVYSNSFVSISDVNRYSGVKLKTGIQYTLPKIKGREITIGAVIELPTSLSGAQTRNSYKVTSSDVEVAIETDIENELDDFELPLAYGFGITSQLNKSITTSFDFKKLLWGNTNQLQNTESYVDQDIYAFGLEYYNPSKRNLNSSWNKIKYRFGFNYNTGFLQISKTQIDSRFVSIGLGIPITKDKTNFNISYSYGKEGTIGNNLIEENYHKITLNLNFVGRWFEKRKFF